MLANIILGNQFFGFTNSTNLSKFLSYLNIILKYLNINYSKLSILVSISKIQHAKLL